MCAKTTGYVWSRRKDDEMAVSLRNLAVALYWKAGSGGW